MVGSFLYNAFTVQRRGPFEGEIEEHLAALTEALTARGLPLEEAQFAAWREFGAIEPMKEHYRDQARLRPLENLARDLRFAWRQCGTNPGFALLAILSLALGIGANTALFSFVNAILLQRLPVKAPERLVLLQSDGKALTLSYAQVKEFDRDAKQLTGLAGRFPIDVSVAIREQPRWTAAELITGDYFPTLGVEPALGRLLTEADLDKAPGDPVCVISYRFWKSEFEGDPHTIGRAVRINTRQYRIVGVSQRGFSGVEAQEPVDLQIPATRLIDFMPSFVGMRDFDWTRRLSFFSAVGRLRPQGTLAGAAAELTRLNRALAGSSNVDRASAIQVVSGETGLAGAGRLAQPAEILLVTAAVVILIACANLATLLLSRTSARASEFAVRLAIGCSRRRIAAQVLSESALLAGVGSLAGMGLAFALDWAILYLLNRTNPAIHQLQIAPDKTVLLFAMLLACLCVFLFGAAPALQAARTAALGSSPGNANGAARVRQTFVAVQVALSFVVLFAAGLLTRTLSSLETVPLGYHPDEVAVVEIRPAAGGYTGTQASRFYSQLVERVRAIPGIRAASTAFGINLRDAVPMQLDDSSKGKGALAVNLCGVSAGYFATMGARVVAGRDFNGLDTPDKPQVYIISGHLARTYLQGKNPIGRSLRQDGRDMPVVGVVSDFHDYGLRDANPNTVYQFTGQLLASSETLLARCQGGCGNMLPALARSIRRMDPRTPILSIHTMQTEVEGALANERVLGLLSALFAALAVLLTAAGLYGVVSYSVTRRTREIGLRLAIGAPVRSIVGLLSRETAVLVGVGTLLGVPGALAGVGLLKSQLFGVTEHDPASLAGAALCITLTAMLAALVPLRRAVKIPPQQALRVD